MQIKNVNAGYIVTVVCLIFMLAGCKKEYSCANKCVVCGGTGTNPPICSDSYASTQDFEDYIAFIRGEGVYCPEAEPTKTTKTKSKDYKKALELLNYDCFEQ